MNLGRDDLRALATSKVNDAILLFRAARYSNSYYLFGYGAELALKARIARVFSGETIPDRKFVNDIHTHDLDRLVALAGLKELLEEARNASPLLDANWSSVSDWSEETRYDIVDVFRATAMHDAMIGAKDGVFEWLQNNW